VNRGGESEKRTMTVFKSQPINPSDKRLQDCWERALVYFGQFINVVQWLKDV